MRGLGGAVRSVVCHLKEVGGFNGPLDRTREDLRAELASLGLLGSRFSVEEYRAALEGRLGIKIEIEEIPDRGAAWSEEFVAEGDIAEVLYSPVRREAIIVVRDSLREESWPTYELAVYHELSHLAAGHHLRLLEAWVGAKDSTFERLALGFCGEKPEFEAEGNSIRSIAEAFEVEARNRAKWLVFAGMFARTFESEGADRVA